MEIVASLLTNLALCSASSSALCRGSAAAVADARDKPEHDERGVGRLCQQSDKISRWRSCPVFSGLSQLTWQYQAASSSAASFAPSAKSTAARA
ncbi:hypothetical protein GFL84_36405 [Rhizobium leguminosarum bv. viciae]|nr:hypothetical protein [Rhizobium leguminosarum bv. viciae]NKM82661.1 hypothetical protein [Rhizobium leguminosarum bv. viciae]